MNIFGCVDGAKIAHNTTVVDSYIHDLGVGGDTHSDDLQCSGCGNVVVKHNTLIAAGAQTSVLQLGNEFVPINGVLFEDNVVAGGGFTIFGGDSDRFSNVTGIRIVNNRFGRRLYPQLRDLRRRVYVGWATEWSGNVWQDRRAGAAAAAAVEAAQAASGAAARAAHAPPEEDHGACDTARRTRTAGEGSWT